MKATNAPTHTTEVKRMERVAKAICADMGYAWEDQAESGVGLNGHDPRLPSRQDFRDAAEAAIRAWGSSANDQAALLAEVLRDGILPPVLRGKVWSAVNG